MAICLDFYTIDDVFLFAELVNLLLGGLPCVLHGTFPWGSAVCSIDPPIEVDLTKTFVLALGSGMTSTFWLGGSIGVGGGG